MTKAKPDRDMKAVCLASSIDWRSLLKDRNISTKLPAILCLKTCKAVLPRWTAAVTSTRCFPVKVSCVVCRTDCMASAEDCCSERSNSFRSPTSPVTLLPAAWAQNQQLCSLSFCCPTRVKTRFMCSTLANKSPMAEPNVAVSSRIALTSAMDLPSTSRSWRSKDMRWMPASRPKNRGSAGDPFSVSSAMFKPWHSTSATLMVTLSDAVYVTKRPAKEATKMMGTKQARHTFCQMAPGRGVLRSAQRQHLRQGRKAAVQQHTCQTAMKNTPTTTGMPKISKLKRYS
mmetsp:Transcript_34649/g.56744  ORF Transcript_34649/g.56744 Transcript_34649/m.56744 type:complete len:286 (-) Transcript_34649:154-1011(-)